LRVLIFSILALLAGYSPARAETRNFTVTSFDKIRVIGPFSVNLRTGPGPSARAVGSPRALDGLKVDVQGRTLTISAGLSAWGGWKGENPGGATLFLTTPGLVAASLTGAGDLNIDRAKAARFDLSLAGSGDVAIGAIEADRLSILVNGSGKATIGGKVAQARAILQGSGAIMGEKLAAVDLDVTVSGSGDVSLAASRTAKVSASGTGDVLIAGKPACSVRATGSGAVRCGAVE